MSLCARLTGIEAVSVSLMRIGFSEPSGSESFKLPGFIAACGVRQWRARALGVLSWRPTRTGGALDFQRPGDRRARRRGLVSRRHAVRDHHLLQAVSLVAPRTSRRAIESPSTSRVSTSSAPPPPLDDSVSTGATGVAEASLEAALAIPTTKDFTTK